MTVFGTRPEAIKFAPVIRSFGDHSGISVANIVSSQHTDLLRPLIDLFSIPVFADLDVMRHDQQLNQLLCRIVEALDAQIAEVAPDLVIVQGDTTTALAGALAAHNRKVPVAHIEAGLRSGNRASPFPEEMNRRLISQIASLHFAATQPNKDNLVAEGVDPARVVVTGNPVVDALQDIRTKCAVSSTLAEALADCSGRKKIVLTAHRRENFGDAMRGNFEALRRFVSTSDEYALIFPVHPNPSVRTLAEAVFGDATNVTLLAPLEYPDFIHLLSEAWLIVSDSGGIQEEAPSLGKPLLVLRENTERPEAIAAGVARLVGNASALETELALAAAPGSWIDSVNAIQNPFGDGRAAMRIVETTADFLAHQGVANPNVTPPRAEPGPFAPQVATGVLGLEEKTTQKSGRIE